MAVGISNILALLGGVALFLFGMGLMGDSLKLVAGQRLELILYRLSNTPLKGVLLGTAVTAVIQSSSATSAMVVGFVNSGMMKLSQAIGIVLGANIGTSVTGWILCLSYISSSDALSLLSSATITAIAAIASMVLFILMQRAGGGPDRGQEAFQMYVPCALYLLAALFSLLMAALSRRKLRSDRAAKQAAKERTGEAKAEKAPPEDNA